MKYIVLSLFYLLLHSLIPWSLPVTFASVLYSQSQLKSHLLFFVVMGVFEDILFLRPLGLTSLLLITLHALSWLLHSYYRSYALWWSLGIGLLGQGLMLLLFDQSLSVSLLLFQVASIGGFYYLYQRIFDRDGIYVGT